MRTNEQKLECIRKAILNSQDHCKANDPARVYSQYIRYAMDQFSRLNLYISENAKGLTKNDIIFDHVIPQCIVARMLLKLVSPSNEDIMNVIQNHYVICKITKTEDNLLTTNCLKSKMPEGWDEKTGRVFARYEAVGIEFCRISANVSN